MRGAVAILLLTLTSAAFAADLTVMSAGALESGIMQLARAFETSSGHAVRVEIGNAPQLTARLTTGASADVLVAPAALVDQAVAAGTVVRDTRVTVGRVGVAIAVRSGATVPDVSSVDALRAALVAADAVIYNQGSSGTYIESLLARLGIAARVEAKTVRVLNGEAVTERLTSGGGTEIAFMAMSDAVRGTTFRTVGPLPAEVQNFTAYDAAVMTATHERAAAGAFLRFVTSAAAKQTWQSAGVEE